MADPLDEFMANLNASASKGGQKRAKTLVEEEEEEEHLEREKWDCDKASTLDDGTRLGYFPEQTEIRIVTATEPSLLPYVGKVGRVIDFGIEDKRYTVHIEEPDKEEVFLSIPVAHLQQIVRGVEVENLVSRPELNGLKASLMEFNSVSGRYQVEISPTKSRKKVKTDQIVVALKPANLLLPVGTRVRIQGLLKTPKFNGTWGMVIGLAMTVDQKQVETTRYSVQVSQRNVLNLKRENCFP